MLVAFNVSYFIPKGSMVKQANLRLTAMGNVEWDFPFAIYPIEEKWQERVVTASTLPLYNQEQALAYNMDFINSTMYYPVTQIVQSWVDGELEENGLLLIANVIQTTARFHAREGDYNLSPTLEVIFDGPAPEPTATAGSTVTTPPTLPDFANPEEAVLSALIAWETNDPDLFTRHFYLGRVDADPALEALNSCNLPVEALDFITTPATDIGPQMSKVDANYLGQFIGSFLVIDANRYRLTKVTLVCSN